MKRKIPSKAASSKKSGAKAASSKKSGAKAAPRKKSGAKAAPTATNRSRSSKPAKTVFGQGAAVAFDATALAQAVAASPQLDAFSAAYEQTQQTVEALEYRSCRYITDDLSDNSDVQLRVALAEFNLSVKNQAEGYTFPTLGMVLLSEYRDGDGDNAEYKVLSIADVVVPVDDAYDLTDFTE